MWGWIFGGNDPPAPPPPATPPPPPPTPSPPPMSNPEITGTVAYIRTFPDLNNSSVVTKINAQYPQSLYQDANSVDIEWVDNYATPPGGGGIGAVYINHRVNNRTIGGESIHHGVNLCADLVSGFNISHTQITQTKRLMGADSSALWWNNFSPNRNFATHPDADGVVHRWDSGSCRIGEVNYGNAWGDFGMVTRGVDSHWCAGIEFFPDWLSGSTGSQGERHYHASWAVGIGGAGADASGAFPKNWLGLTVFANGIVGKNDHVGMLPGAKTGNTSGGGGYAVDLHGSADAANPIGKAINLSDAMDIGIDMRSARFTDAAMQLTDDQPIRLGSVWLRGHQGHLQTSANGTNWTNLT